VSEFIAIQPVNTGSPIDKPLNQLIMNMNAMIGSTDPRLQVVLVGAMQDSGLAVMADSGTVQPRVESAIPALPGTLVMQTIDYSKPPAIEGLAAVSAGHSVLLSWDLPLNATYGHAVLYRATTNAFANAEVIGTTTGNVYPDPLGESSATRYYWVRQANKNDGAILSNLNAGSGTSATTAQFGETDIGPNSITTGMLQALVVTAAKIAALTITAGQIAANAIETDKIKANAIIASKILAGIINAGHMSANSITAANAAIANLAVTSGKIASLSVDTLQLANQAVTIGVSAYTSGDLLLTSTSWFTAQSVSITSTGAPIAVTVSFGIALYGATTATNLLFLEIKRGTTVIWASQPVAQNDRYTTTAYRPEFTAASVTLEDTPGVGTFTYYAYVSVVSSTVTSGVNRRSLLVEETKK
jgi:hypothetical protein